MSRTAVVAVQGGLDVSTLVRWEAEVANAAGRAHAVVLDLSAVDFLDSAGVHGLFRMLAMHGGERRRIIVVAPRGGRVRRLLEILDLSTVASLCESREEALAAAA